MIYPLPFQSWDDVLSDDLKSRSWPPTLDSVFNVAQPIKRYLYEGATLLACYFCEPDPAQRMHLAENHYKLGELYANEYAFCGDSIIFTHDTAQLLYPRSAFRQPSWPTDADLASARDMATKCPLVWEVPFPLSDGSKRSPEDNEWFRMHLLTQICPAITLACDAIEETIYSFVEETPSAGRAWLTGYEKQLSQLSKAMNFMRLSHDRTPGLKVSQAQIARAFDISPSKVSRIVNDRTGSPLFPPKDSNGRFDAQLVVDWMELHGFDRPNNWNT